MSWDVRSRFRSIVSQMFSRRSHLSPPPSQPKQKGYYCCSAAPGLSAAVSSKAADMADIVNEAVELKLHSCIGFTGEPTRSPKGSMFLGHICLQFTVVGNRTQSTHLGLAATLVLQLSSAIAREGVSAVGRPLMSALPIFPNTVCEFFLALPSLLRCKFLPLHMIQNTSSKNVQGKNKTLVQSCCT